MNVEALASYSALNELRCLNNCIKHSGYADAELASLGTKWAEGDELKYDGLKDAFDRLKQSAMNFVVELVAEVRK